MPPKKCTRPREKKCRGDRTTEEEGPAGHGDRQEEVSAGQSGGPDGGVHAGQSQENKGPQDQAEGDEDTHVDDQGDGDEQATSALQRSCSAGRGHGRHQVVRSRGLGPLN